MQSGCFEAPGMGQGRLHFRVFNGVMTDCVLVRRTALSWEPNDAARILTRKSSVSQHITKVAMRSQPSTPKARCLFTKLPACHADMHSESCVSTTSFLSCQKTKDSRPPNYQKTID